MAKGRFYVATKGLEDWKALLAEPDKHWKAGFSAQSLAHAWEHAGDFPASVRHVLDASGVEALQGLDLLIGLPEHQVPLPPESGHPSQNDLWILGRGHKGLVSIAVEGKVNEGFDKLVQEWSHAASPGKKLRLKTLCEVLGVAEDQTSGVRYQLLHRTASAIIEAKRFAASHAVMLVHSFSKSNTGLQDYRKFANLLGASGAAAGKITSAGQCSGVHLYLGWVADEVA